LQENKPTTLKQGRHSGKTGGKSRKKIVLGQGPGLYRGKEMYKNLVKTTVKKRKGPK
jgi:hypothetical protein